MAQDDENLISLLFSKKTKATKKPASTEKVVVEEKKVATSNAKLDLTWVKKNKVYLLILAALVFLVYINTIDNGLTSDDKGLLLDQKNLTKFSYIFSDPLAFFWSLVHAPLYALFGINASVLRFPNILMHLGNTFLAFTILSILANPVLGFVVAALFAVHPVLTEGVTWISGGPYSWYAFFFLLSFLLYIKSKSASLTSKTYLASVGVFVIGLFTSNRIMQLFPVFIMYEYLFGDLKKNYKKLIPFTALSLLWGLTYFIQIGGRQNSLQTQYYLEKGTDNPLLQIPFAITNYLLLIFFPTKLTFYHSDLTITQFQLLLFWVGFLVFIGGWVYCFFKNKFLFFWLSFFVISLLITLTPFRIAWIVAERYVYLGTLGILVVVGYFLSRLITRKKTKVLGWVVFSILVAILGIRAMVRNNDWQDEKTLWLATVKSTPASPKAHNNIGVIYTDEQNFKQAEQELVTAVQLKPNYGDAYHNLGRVYYLQRQFDKAVPNFQKALQINPTLVISYEFLASSYFEQGKYDSALAELNKALKIKNNDPDIYINLAIVYRKLNDFEKAKQALELAIRLEPTNQKAQAMYQDLQK